MLRFISVFDSMIVDYMMLPHSEQADLNWIKLDVKTTPRDTQQTQQTPINNVPFHLVESYSQQENVKLVLLVQCWD